MTNGVPQVWGILNVTPDSFSDGFPEPEDAIRHGLDLVAQGADVLDVGGESTRPGARAVPEAEERGRVVPVIRGLRERGVAVPIGVDTRKASVAEAAIDAGATIVNDVSAGLHDPSILSVARERGASLVLMHMKGTPETMAREAAYSDVVEEVLAHLLARAEAARAAGVPSERIWIDPGLGFAKTAEHNLAILRSLERFTGTGRPVLLGASRKSFLGVLTGKPVGERLAGSLACAARAAEAGVAAVRVHDVGPTRDLLRVWSAVRGQPLL